MGNCVWQTLRKHAQHLGNSGKAYANELLKAYEATAASASDTLASAPRTLQESAGDNEVDSTAVVCDTVNSTSLGEEISVPSATMGAEDDFEALALGVPAPAGPSVESTGQAVPSLSAPADDDCSGIQGVSEDKDGNEGDAREAVMAQRSNSDVFT